MSNTRIVLSAAARMILFLAIVIISYTYGFADGAQQGASVGYRRGIQDLLELQKKTI